MNCDIRFRTVAYLYSEYSMTLKSHMRCHATSLHTIPCYDTYLAHAISCHIMPYHVFRARGKISSVTTACHAASALLSALLMNVWLKSGFDTAAGKSLYDCEVYAPCHSRPSHPVSAHQSCPLFAFVPHVAFLSD